MFLKSLASYTKFMQGGKIFMWSVHVSAIEDEGLESIDIACSVVQFKRYLV